MPIHTSLKLLFTLIIFYCLNGIAFANYKHKIVVTKFSEPKNWNLPYSPGKIISDYLERKLVQGGNFHVITDEKSPTIMHQKMSESKMTDKPLNQIPKESPMKEGMRKRMQMEKQGSHASSSQGINIEPAIHYLEDNPSFNLIQNQDPLNGMMKNMDKVSNESMKMHSDPYPWPVKLGAVPEKASLFKIMGQVVKFDPGTIDPSMVNSGNSTIRNSENAELEVKIQLVQNKTGRVINKQTFRAFSNSGLRPFSEEIDFSPTEQHGHKTSSMSLALSFLKNEMFNYVLDSISNSALEGEIIAVKNEEVLINIGEQNGVEIGDKFRVYSVGLGLHDPLTEYDLGDIYVKTGIIQVMDSMLGFSKAVIIVGKDFLPGNLVQSFNKISNTKQRFSSGLKAFDSEEKIPWWDFSGIKSIP